MSLRDYTRSGGRPEGLSVMKAYTPRVIKRAKHHAKQQRDAYRVPGAEVYHGDFLLENYEVDSFTDEVVG